MISPDKPPYEQNLLLMQPVCICVLKLQCKSEQPKHIIPFIFSFNISSLCRSSAAQSMVYAELSAPESDPSHYV